MSRKYKTDEERYQALREYHHKYYLRKKEDKEYVEYFKNYCKEYYENNKEKCKEYKRNYYIANRDREREKKRIYYQKIKSEKALCK